MNNLQTIEQEKSVLRWGGLAGMLGGVLFILAMVVVFAGPIGKGDPVDLAGWVTRFPDVKAARVLENVTYLMALILGVPLFLTLYRVLRSTCLALALFGSAMGILGLVSMAVSATPHVAHATLYDLYYAPGATSADQATLALMWQAIRGIFDAMLYVGFLAVSLGLTAFGVGMFKAPTFGKGFAGVGLALGLAGLVTAVFQIIEPASMIGMGSYFAIIISSFILGWKLFNLSKAS